MRRASIHFTLIVCLFGALGVAVDAQSRLRGSQDAAFWDAVGRVTFGPPQEDGGCSGTLIAPDLVLTAAHCVPSATETTAEQLESFRFSAGWQAGRAIATGRAKSFHQHPDYRPGPSTRQSLYADLAIVVLQTPIEGVLPIRIGKPPSVEVDVSIAGFINRLPQALSITDHCGHFGPLTGLMFLTCPVVGGNSGGPVIHHSQTGSTLVAVISSRGRGGAYAALPGGWVEGFLAPGHK